MNPHAPSCPWHTVTEKIGAPNIKWCEQTLCAWISEPANTWSNIGYILIGLYILSECLRKNYSSELKYFGPITIFMGLMSFTYHLSNFYGSQILDFVGMFFFLGWATGMNLIRLGSLKRSHLMLFNLIYSVTLTCILHLLYLQEIKFQIMILFLAGIVLITEILAQQRTRSSQKWLNIAFGIFAIAFGFSVLDGKRFWCTPENHGWFSQGHALWHWIGALGMLAIFKHYCAINFSTKD